MHNRLFVLATLLIFSFSALAEEYNFVVWTKSGEQISFPVNEKPKVTHNNNCYTITSNSTTVEYPIVNVMKFTLEPQDPGGIEALKPIGSNIFQSDNTLKLSGFQVGSVVKIFAINGQLLFTQTINDEGLLSIDLSPLPHGIYVVSTECITCKFIKR